jgi:methyltransferase-like protein 6
LYCCTLPHPTHLLFLQCIGRHIYKRGDGTLAYFYTTDELSGLAAAAGLEAVECEYVCVFNRNRKTGLELRRTFVHGVFRRPLP